MSHALQSELVLGNLNRLLENLAVEQSEEHESIPELELVYEYRDAKARLRALSEINATYIQEEQIDRIAFDFPKRHFSPEREKIEWLTREYWPVPGSEDTELRCLMEQEADHGEASEVHT